MEGYALKRLMFSSDPDGERHFPDPSLARLEPRLKPLHATFTIS